MNKLIASFVWLVLIVFAVSCGDTEAGSTKPGGNTGILTKEKVPNAPDYVHIGLGNAKEEFEGNVAGFDKYHNSSVKTVFVPGDTTGATYLETLYEVVYMNKDKTKVKNSMLSTAKGNIWNAIYDGEIFFQLILESDGMKKVPNVTTVTISAGNYNFQAQGYTLYESKVAVAKMKSDYDGVDHDKILGPWIATEDNGSTPFPNDMVYTLVKEVGNEIYVFEVTKDAGVYKTTAVLEQLNDPKNAAPDNIYTKF